MGLNVVEGREDMKTLDLPKAYGVGEPTSGVPTPLNDGNKMRSISSLVLCLVAASAVLVSDLARAQVPPLVVGGVVSPAAPHETIRLVSAETIIRLYESTCEIDTVCRFFNDGDLVEERLGFPIYVDHVEVRSLPILKAWVDGRKLTFTTSDMVPLFWSTIPSLRSNIRTPRSHRHPLEERRLPMDLRECRWLVKQVSFKGHTETLVRTAYRPPYFFDHAYFLYGTASYWNGSIDRAAFIVDAGNVGGLKNIEVSFPVAAGPRIVSDNVALYELSNFKPAPGDFLEIRHLRNRSPWE